MAYINCKPFFFILFLKNISLDVQVETYYLSEVGFENYANLEVLQLLYIQKHRLLG